MLFRSRITNRANPRAEKTTFLFPREHSQREEDSRGSRKRAADLGQDRSAGAVREKKILEALEREQPISAKIDRRTPVREKKILEPLAREELISIKIDQRAHSQREEDSRGSRKRAADLGQDRSAGELAATL